MLTALLGTTAGIPKVTRMAQEVTFFQEVGLGEAPLIAFGALQMVAGIATVPAKTRLIGAAGSAVMFALSAAMLLSANNVVFGLVSLLPVAAAVIVIRATRRPEANARS